LEQYAFTAIEHGLDDFDDSAEGPAVLDFVRFLGSIDLGTRQRDWTDERENLFDAFFRGYRQATRDPDYAPPAPSYAVRMRDRSAMTHEAFLEWAESLMQPFSEEESRAVAAGLDVFSKMVSDLRPGLPESYFKLKRAGWLRMGVGSALAPKQLGRFEGKTSAPEDDFILEAKKVSDLGNIDCISVPGVGQAFRVVKGHGEIGRIRHEIVAVVPDNPLRGLGPEDWWVRSWEASYRELQLDELESAGELAEVVHDAGAQLGAGHIRESVESLQQQIRYAQLQQLDALEPKIRAVAKQMAEQLLEAHQAFQAQNE
jgi:hypothetical protein